MMLCWALHFITIWSRNIEKGLQEACNVISEMSVQELLLEERDGQPEKQHHVIHCVCHGVHDRASKIEPIRAYFKSRGYKDYELYATSWGTDEFNAIDCAYVLKVRRFIASVAEFTNRPVKVIGYSAGAALARKAIIGGTCVDTKASLNGPLPFAKVNTLLTVAGANLGASMCNSWPQSWSATCRTSNGLKCNSAFLNDINKVSNVGKINRIVTLLSKKDDITGYTPCGTKLNIAPGNKETTTVSSYNHQDTMLKTAAAQYALVN